MTIDNWSYLIFAGFAVYGVVRMVEDFTILILDTIENIAGRVSSRAGSPESKHVEEVTT